LVPAIFHRPIMACRPFRPCLSLPQAAPPALSSFTIGAPSKNPNGIPSSSPGLRGHELPRVTVITHPNSEGVAPAAAQRSPAHDPKIFAHPALTPPELPPNHPDFPTSRPNFASSRIFCSNPRCVPFVSFVPFASLPRFCPTGTPDNSPVIHRRVTPQTQNQSQRDG